ncbi:MAG TPA: acetate/propionate family kinase [Gammaproteobacteria bacterium]|mgnify:CR=1 FL=1|nr:acetate/propionate family kinase [Gammaproteobacteria bacterium]
MNVDTDQSQSLLTINSGSSSLRFALFSIHEPDTPQCLYRGGITAIGGGGRFHVHDAGGDLFHAQDTAIPDHGHALQILLAWLSKEMLLQKLVGVGHRVVHGGRRFHAPVRVTEENLVYLKTLIPLAPNHQPACLLGITTLQGLQPGLPQVACFDTAFHHDRPAVEQYFALPAHPKLDDVRRYGFHGLSYEYIASILPDHLGKLADGKVIVAHLGHGASLCAMNQRRSVATTMTFTPLDGIPMGTRCGSIDPAVVLYLQDQGMTAGAVSDLLYFQSGLLGVSKETDDMAELLASSSAQAQLAIEQFVHHTVRSIGSLAAALGGVDALVFTAGIGEHAAPIRAAIGERCQWLGLYLDRSANQLGHTLISRSDSPVGAWVIGTDEESMIARHSLRVLEHHKQRNTL